MENLNKVTIFEKTSPSSLNSLATDLLITAIETAQTVFAPNYFRLLSVYQNRLIQP